MKFVINHLISASVICLTIVASVVIAASRNLNAEVPWGPGSESVSMVTGLVSASTESSWIRHLPELTSGNSALLDVVEFPYVNLKLEPPAGFRIADRFHGLQSEENNDYIMINTSPSPFATATSTSFRKLAESSPNNEFRQIQIDGQPAVYAHIFQGPPGRMVEKHIVAFGNDVKSWVVTAALNRSEADAEGKGQAASQSLKDSIMSLSRINSCDNPYLTIETDIMQESDVDFRLESDTLKPTAGWTKSLVFTKEGVFPQKSPTDPFFRAVPSVENRQVSEEYRKNFAIVNAIPSNDFEVIKAHSVLSVTLDGLPGYEIVASANDRATETKVLLYSVVLFKPDSYIKMHGWVGSDESAIYLKKFREIARSFSQQP